MKPMNVIKVVGYNESNRRSLNEILEQEPNNPNWIDTTEVNNNYSKVQAEMVNKGNFSIKNVPNLNTVPARLLFFGLK